MSKEYPCIHFNDGKCKKFSVNGCTSFCVLGPCEYKTMSNADRIRAMSDEEMGKFLCSLSDCSACKWGTWGWGGCDLKEWLKQPVEGAEAALEGECNAAD